MAVDQGDVDAFVGGGPTGVEMAGTIGELARVTLASDFRSFDPRQARVVLVEGQTRVLPTFDCFATNERMGVAMSPGDRPAVATWYSSGWNRW